jgi:hypothetical protein
MLQGTMGKDIQEIKWGTQEGETATQLDDGSCRFSWQHSHKAYDCEIALQIEVQ